VEVSSNRAGRGDLLKAHKLGSGKVRTVQCHWMRVGMCLLLTVDHILVEFGILVFDSIVLFAWRKGWDTLDSFNRVRSWELY
jgi:hypothetical protein